MLVPVYEKFMLPAVHEMAAFYRISGVFYWYIISVDTVNNTLILCKIINAVYTVYKRDHSEAII